MEKDELPEEFLSIKWETPPSHTNEFLSEDYIQENSVAYKILNDTFTRVWSSDSDDDCKKKEKPAIVAKEGQPNVPRRIKLYKSFKAYPKLSSLTINQHEAYLNLMKKFSNNISPFLSKQEQAELLQYKNLQQKVGAEQIEYLDFLRNFAMSNVSRYSSINPDIKKYINELWQVQLKNPLKYPRFYRPYRTVGLVLNDPKELLDLVPQEEILTKGRVDILNLERRTYKIERVYSKFVRRHPIIDGESANTPTTYNCPVSQDLNAEVIAQRANVDFVLSSSSLKRICDNYPPFNKSWELPVIVKELDVEENGHVVKKRIIFIDKALPRRRMTVVDKLMLFHKIAIKKFFVRHYLPGLCRGGLHIDNLNRSVDQYEDFPQSGQCDENDLESFGVDRRNCSKSTLVTSCGNAEGVQLNEKSANLKEDSVEMNLTVESIDLSQHNNNADASSACMSDSDDERWVIDDPEFTSETKSEKKSQNHPALCSRNSKEKAPANSEVDAENKLSNEELSKPHKRHVVKMLENLKKVGKITGMKGNNSRESISSITNAHPGSSNNAEAFSAEKNSVPNEDESGGVCDSKTNISGKTPKAKRGQLSILDDLLEQQKKLFENAHPKSNPPPQPVDVQDKKDFLEDYWPIPPPIGGNYTYRLFSLKKKSVPSPGYKLLIRCKTDAREASPSQKTATIVPKLEFQPEFGAEIVTVSELTQDWLSLRIRPNSFLVRARIDAFTSDVIMLEHKECKDFYKEEKYHNMQASSCLHTLEAVLRAFCDLPPGKYMFTHEPKMGAFGNVFMATNDTGGGLYDLHEQFKVDTNSEEPQVLSNLWIPIDFTIITPHLERFGRVPGTFIPRSNPTKKKKKRK